MKSYAEIDAELTAAGGLFEIEQCDVAQMGHGTVPTRVWRCAPASLRVVLEQAAVGGDRDFIVLGDERLTHREHFRRVATLAQRLIDDFGVVKGDRIAIAMRNYPEWSIAFFAATTAGAVAVPLNAWWTGDELAFGIRDSGATVLIADGERLARLVSQLPTLELVATIGVHIDDRKPDTTLPDGIVELDALVDPSGDGLVDQLPDVPIDPDDHATIFYTSGTTGFPKGVLGTHRNICNNLVGLMYVGARTAARQAPVDTSSTPAPGVPAPAGPPVTLVPVPLFHATGCHSILVAQAYFGGTLVFMRRWDPEEGARLIARERVTAFSAVPAMVWELLNVPSLAEHDLSSLRSLGGGGAAAPPEILRRADQHLPGRGMSTGYGLTETSSLVASISGDDYRRHADSCGVAIPVCRIRVVDVDGIDVPDGEVGELWINGPNVVQGYWHRPEETAATFSDGWLHSGDIGRVDAEGFVYILDRAKDIIIRGGENVSGAEVEAALFEHPAVADAAAVGIPHPVLGEEVGAVVYLRDADGATSDELRTHAASRLAAFKVPSHILFWAEPLPRNPAGKVLKRELRDQVVAISSDSQGEGR